MSDDENENNYPPTPPDSATSAQTAPNSIATSVNATTATDPKLMTMADAILNGTDDRGGPSVSQVIAQFSASTTSAVAAGSGGTTPPNSATGSAAQAPPPPSFPPFTESESRAVVKRAHELAAKVKPIEIEISRITSPKEFRIARRGHSDREGGPIEEVTSNIKAVGLLNPLIVLHWVRGKKRKHIILLSGAKRLKSAEQAGQKKVWCRVVAFEALIPAATELAWGFLKTEAIIAEVAKSIVYTESTLSSNLSDSSILSLLLQIRGDHDFKKKDFDRVMDRLGLVRKSKNYRNVKRLWDLVCCPDALWLIEEKMVRMKVFKKDPNLRPMEQKHKADAITRRVIMYANKTRSNSDDRDRLTKAFTSLSNYRDYEIEKIIREVDVPELSPTGKVLDNYRQPRFQMRIDEKRLSIPSLSIDLTDFSPNNVRSIVEAVYNLKSVSDQLQRFLQSISPAEPGGEVLPMRFKPMRTEYGESYYRFLMENCLQSYSNIQKVSQFLRGKDKELAKLDELKDKSFPEQTRFLIERLIERSKKEWVALQTAKRKEDAALDKVIREFASGIGEDPQLRLPGTNYMTRDDEVKLRMKKVEDLSHNIKKTLKRYKKTVEAISENVKDIMAADQDQSDGVDHEDGLVDPSHSKESQSKGHHKERKSG